MNCPVGLCLQCCEDSLKATLSALSMLSARAHRRWSTRSGEAGSRLAVINCASRWLSVPGPPIPRRSSPPSPPGGERLSSGNLHKMAFNKHKVAETPALVETRQINLGLTGRGTAASLPQKNRRECNIETTHVRGRPS